MAVTLTSPDYDSGLTGVTFIIDKENGTSTTALSATEVSAYPGTYSLSTTITNAPVGYNRVRMFDSGNVHRMTFAVQVIADGAATVTGGSVQGLRDRAGNLAEHDATQAAIAAIGLPIILPTLGVTPDAMESQTIKMQLAAGLTVPIPIYDATGEPVSLTGLTLEFVVNENKKTQVLLIANNDLPRSSNQVTVTLPDSLSSRIGRDLEWALRTPSQLNSPLAKGTIEVEFAAKRWP